MSIRYLGRDGTSVVYASDELAVVLDEKRQTVEAVNVRDAVLASASWVKDTKYPKKTVRELAHAALTEMDIKVLSSSDRMYTIPKGVVAEAKRGLKWRKEEGRGGTPVGMNTARTLAKGGQIGIRKVRHIAKYFPRHEVDKKAKGYEPGEDNYPSNGRIAWALWGGDAGQRWASAIVEREDAKKSTASLIASYFDEEASSRVDYASFALERSSEFFVRIRLDHGGIDRLYRVEPDGSCQVWDDGYWDSMGNINHDFETYDKSLDEPYDRASKVYVPVDRETAIKLSALFDSEPYKSVSLRQIEFEETDMFEQAMPELDWQMLDQLSSDSVEELVEEEEFDDGLMASGTATFSEEGDGIYTSEERSEKASKQVRDKLGRFAQTGSTVVIGGDYNYQGVITAQNPEAGTVSVQLDNGNTVEVPGNLTQEVSTFEPISYIPPSTLDFTGILGEPRTPIDQAGVTLPGRLPALNRDNLTTVVNDWGNWASDQRLAPEYEPTPAPPFIPKQPPSYETAMGRFYQGAFGADGKPKPGWNPAIAPNVANDPLLRDWLDRVYGGSSGEYRGGWYTPKVPVEARKSREEVYSPSNRREWDERYSVYASGVVAAAEKPKELTPETSDVAPMYMAIVANDDPQAVMELISLVPANTKSVTPVAFKREPGKWVRDDKILADLNSPTPPPVVVLDNENLSSVVEQIDGDRAVVASVFAHTNNSVIRALMAAGGLDRNRGNAEKLRRYWTFGPGALKIRWNTPGDWTRCNRQLRKYMGPRAKGYCALRHKEMTGVWPGDKRNVGKKKKRRKSLRSSGEIEIISNELETLKDSETIISEFTLRARANAAKSRMVGRSGPKPTEHGSQFVIPLVIPEEVETGDGRIFQKDSITMRDLPLPLMWQIKSGQGHDGSVVVGQILHMERTSEGIGNAYGFFDVGEFGQEAERLVRHGFIRGVSADMDKFEADEPKMPEIDASDNELDETDKDKSDKINITSARVMAVTIVPKPAFQECYIQVVDESGDVEEETMQPDGVYVDGVNPLDASALVACGLVADAIPVAPPKEWFDNPKLNKATPLTITDDGRVFGHIAAWHVDHIGMSAGTRPPRSRSNYSYFHTGVIRTDSGDDVPVGQLTLAGGHAGLEASAEEAVRHYDDTASAFADVHAGEDAYGIWVAGALRPGTAPEQIRAARASAPSGDWRPIKGRLELVAVCQVNVPGFPIARARVASGQVMALVAAGANTLAQLKYDPLAELNAKVTQLEAVQYAPKAEEAKERFSTMRQELFAQRTAELASKVKKVKDTIEEDSWEYMIEVMDDNPENETAVISRRIRQRLAKEGKALPDGSFPIRNVNDLRNAVRAYGRAKTGAKALTRKHIMKRAKDLKREDVLPPRWSTAYSADGEELSLHDRALAAAAQLDEFRDYSEEVRMEYAKKGWALPDGSFPIENVEDLKRAIKAHGRASDIEKAKRHIRKRARALDAADLIPDEWKSASNVEDFRLRAELAAEFVNSEALFLKEKNSEFAKVEEEIAKLDPEEADVVKREANRQESGGDSDDRIKYTPETQPRDAEGKFRRVLARLKSDLGSSGLQRVVEKVEEAENLDSAGDYEQAAEAADQLISLIDRLDEKALNPEALENVRSTAAELGEVIANLPFAFGEQTEKIRFSDVPPVLRDLMEDMIERVEDKIGQEDADVATEQLKIFMSGGDYMSQSDISSEMSKLLRLLT
jgi:hypothetical protein